MLIKKNSGLTMIEVLVSIVILSIGLLGVAGLQVMGMKNNHSAYLRTQATTLAYQFADILRSNLTEVNAKKLGNNKGDILDQDDIVADYTSTAECYTVQGCNSEQMLENDLLAWLDNLQNTLPEGRVSITNPSYTKTANDYLVFSITISWVDDKADVDGDGNTRKSFTTSFRP